jgi:cell wall-associated NlpC family hydrolase
MTRDEVVTEARQWLSVPYRHKGRSRTGLDCIGLLVVVGRALGVPHEDRTDYTDYPTAERVIQNVMDRYLELAPAASAWPGSIGLFADERLPCHCGLFSLQHGRVHLIHAMLRRRVVLEEPWLNGRGFRLIRRYQFPGLAD